MPNRYDREQVKRNQEYARVESFIRSFSEEWGAKNIDNILRRLEESYSRGHMFEAHLGYHHIEPGDSFRFTLADRDDIAEPIYCSLSAIISDRSYVFLLEKENGRRNEASKWFVEFNTSDEVITIESETSRLFKFLIKTGKLEKIINRNGLRAYDEYFRSMQFEMQDSFIRTMSLEDIINFIKGCAVISYYLSRDLIYDDIFDNWHMNGFSNFGTTYAGFGFWADTFMKIICNTGVMSEAVLRELKTFLIRINSPASERLSYRYIAPVLHEFDRIREAERAREVQRLEEAAQAAELRKKEELAKEKAKKKAAALALAAEKAEKKKKLKELEELIELVNKSEKKTFKLSDILKKKLKIKTIEEDIATIATINSSLKNTEWKKNLPLVLGIGDRNIPILLDLAALPHLLVTGTQSEMNSSILHGFVSNLVSKYSLEDLQFVFIDSSGNELIRYQNNIPANTRARVAASKRPLRSMAWAVGEMERRERILSNSGDKSFMDFHNKDTNEKLPYIVIVVNELSDFLIDKERGSRELLEKLSAQCEKVGIYLIVATTNLDPQLLTPALISNIPAKMVFKLKSENEFLLKNSPSAKVRNVRWVSSKAKS